MHAGTKVNFNLGKKILQKLWVSEFKQKKLNIKERACQENTLVTCPKLTSLKSNLNFITIVLSCFFIIVYLSPNF